MIEVHVNGLRVQMVDAGIGYGTFGWRVVSLGRTGEVTATSGYRRGSACNRTDT